MFELFLAKAAYSLDIVQGYYSVRLVLQKSSFFDSKITSKLFQM